MTAWHAWLKWADSLYHLSLAGRVHELVNP
jgi:hypothetical protein